MGDASSQGVAGEAHLGLLGQVNPGTSYLQRAVSAKPRTREHVYMMPAVITHECYTVSRAEVAIETEACKLGSGPLKMLASTSIPKRDLLLIESGRVMRHVKIPLGHSACPLAASSRHGRNTSCYWPRVHHCSVC